MFIAMAAVLDGAIFGDHCSPISDTTLMSSIGAGCDHLDHVTTQAPYALTCMSIALVAGYLPAALGASAAVTYAAAAGTALLVLLVFGRRVEASSAK
jgi:Na+/H+ antiporter NhaC